MEEIKKEIIEYPLNLHPNDKNDLYEESHIEQIKQELSNSDHGSEIRLIRGQEGAVVDGSDELLSNKFFVREDSEIFSLKEEVSEECLHREMNASVTFDLVCAKLENSQPNTMSEFSQHGLCQDKVAKSRLSIENKALPQLRGIIQLPSQVLNYEVKWTNDVCSKFESPEKYPESNIIPSQSTPTNSHALQHCRMNRKICKSSDKVFKCDICPYQSVRKQDLKQHSSTHTGEKPFKCDLCPYQAARKTHVKRHALTHTGEKPFKYDLCHYRALSKREIETHYITHTGEKPFKCDLCPYQAARKMQVKGHLLTHAGEKPFKCDLCPYQTVRKGNIKQHFSTHTGEKPFKCDLCPYQAAAKLTIKRHLLSHTGEKPFKCDLCPYQAARKMQVKIHPLSHSS